MRESRQMGSPGPFFASSFAVLGMMIRPARFSARYSPPDIREMAVSEKYQNAAGLGIFLGFQNFLLALFIASIFSSIVGLIFLLKKQHYIPYGPFLALGTFITYFLQN